MTINRQETEDKARSEGRDAAQLLLDRESDSDPTISVVMPTLNEEEGVRECIEQIKSAIMELGISAEIILSDSSTDQTPAVGRELGAIVYEPDGMGYGYAYQYAFTRARGDFIVMGDADTTYDFEQIPRLLKHLRKEDADMVIGSRLSGEIKPGAMPALHQYVGNPLLTKFLNTFYDAGVSDAHSGFRILTRDALEAMELETTGMEFASEMVMEAAANDLDIVEIPIVYHERKGEETLDSFRDGWRHVRFMLNNAPGYLFSVPGMVLTLSGLLVILLAYSGISINGANPGALTLIAGSFLLILGFQVFLFGVFSTVVTNPVRQPENAFTQYIVTNLTLERGATVGCLFFGTGTLYACFLIYQRLNGGIMPMSYTMDALIALTIMVLGIQTVFSSFFLSAAMEQSDP